MRSSIEKNRRKLQGLGVLIGTLTAIYFVTTLSVTEKEREDLLPRAKGRCENCKANKKNKDLYISHMDHTRNADYNNPDKLKIFCFKCEAEYHLQHIYCPETIGMDMKHNLTTINGHLTMLMRNKDKTDLKYIVKNYPDELRYVYKVLRFDLVRLNMLIVKYSDYFVI